MKPIPGIQGHVWKRPSVSATLSLCSCTRFSIFLRRVEGEPKPMQELKHLGKKSVVRYENPDASILESVPNPFCSSTDNRNGVQPTIDISSPEFTSLCPITGHPDFATIEIQDIPSQRLVESKSLKLYLGSFRQH